jgi:hypothetical protein
MPISRHRRGRGSRSADSLSLTRPRRTKTNKIYLVAAVVIAVLVIGSFGLTTIPFGGGGGVRTGSSSEFVEGVGVRQELMPTGPTGLNNHVDEGQSVDYSTVPATSGDHWERWADCGFYAEGLPDERIVHNLEHGNIVVSYNLPNPEEVDQLKNIVSDVGLANVWGVTRFYPDIPAGTVALATWGVLDVMQVVDGDRIKTFFDTYAGRLGPEEVTCIGAGRIP